MQKNWFLKQCNVFNRDFARPPETCSKAVKGFFPKKNHMGWVPAVIPGSKTSIIGLKTCHNSQPPAWSQHLLKTCKFLGWIKKMFNSFRACYKIILLVKHVSGWKKKRVKQAYPVARPDEHLSQCRPWPAPIIKPIKPIWISLHFQAFQQRVCKL